MRDFLLPSLAENSGGLSSTDLASHWQRADAILNHGEEPPSFVVQSVCSVDNGRVLAAEVLQGFEEHNELAAYVSFTPAAGASSRYLQALQGLRRLLHEGPIEAAKAEFVKCEALCEALPSEMASLIRRYLASKDRNLLPSIEAFFNLPKAFFPCQADGESFLQAKLSENRAIGALAGHVFVAPYGQRAAMRRHLKERSQEATNDDVVCFEQGLNLATLRFTQSAEPVPARGASTSPSPWSVVAAGHGRLYQLFPLVKARFVNARAVFIKNVDNVVGCSEGALHYTRAFLGLHALVMDALGKVRSCLERDDFKGAAEALKPLFGLLPAQDQGQGVEVYLSAPQLEYLRRLHDAEQQKLCIVQWQLFKTPLALFSGEAGDALRRVYARPVNLLAQVAARAGDVGGSPVVIDSPWGELTVCLERGHRKPHNTDEPPYFNPVFVAAELIAEGSAAQANYQEAEDTFWSLVKKDWQGQEVFYHETSLYEVLGNSASAHSLFIEMPRALFNPHKALTPSAQSHT